MSPFLFVLPIILLSPAIQIAKLLTKSGARSSATTASGKFQLGVWPQQLIRTGRSQTTPLAAGLLAVILVTAYSAITLLDFESESTVFEVWGTRGGMAAVLAIPAVIFLLTATGVALLNGARRARQQPDTSDVHLRDYVSGPFLLVAVLAAAAGMMCAIGGTVGELRSNYSILLAVTSPAMTFAAIALLALATFALAGRRIVKDSNRDLPAPWATIVSAQTMYLVVGTALVSGLAAISMGCHIAATRIGLLNPRSDFLPYLEAASFMATASIIFAIVAIFLLTEQQGPMRSLRILHPDQYRTSQELLRAGHPPRESIAAAAQDAQTAPAEPARILNER